MSASKPILSPGKQDGILVTAARGRRHQEAAPTHVTCFCNLEAVAQTSVSSAPTVISLLRSVLSACRGGSFRFARHALASCHFSPRTLRAMEKRGDSSPRLAVYRKGFSVGPAPPVCLQLVVTSTNRWESSPCTSVFTRPQAGVWAFLACSFSYCDKI